MDGIRLNTKNSAIFHRIGAITLQWNKAEYQLERLLQILLMGTAQSDLIISTWGNAQRAQIAKSILSKEETDDRFLKFCLETLFAYNTCRENRNLLVHGNVTSMDKSGFQIVRLTNNLNKRLQYVITLENLQEVERNIIILCAHMSAIANGNCVMRRLTFANAPTLPDKPFQPRNLRETLKPILVDAQDQPQPSQA